MATFKGVTRVLLGSDWKTTLGGLVAAVATALLPVVQRGELPTERDLLLATLLATLGRVSKLELGLDTGRKPGSAEPS